MDQTFQPDTTNQYLNKSSHAGQIIPVNSNSRKKYILRLLALIAVLLIASLTVLNLRTVTKSQQSISTKIPKIYNNRELGIQLSYPDGFIYQELDERAKGGSFHIDIAPDSLYPFISVSISSRRNMSYDEIIASDFCDQGICADPKKAKDIYIGRLSGKLITEVPGPIPVYHAIIQTAAADIRFSIILDNSYSTTMTMDEKKDIFNNLLKSVSFLDKQLNPANFSSEGQNCGRNAGAAGDAQCQVGLNCVYDTKQDEQDGIGVCKKIITKKCTQEALVCPDNTSVSRSGKTCSFDGCPRVPINVASWKTIAHDHFSINMPSSWKEETTRSNGGSVVQTELSGPEGTVTLAFGSGFGGACNSSWIKVQTMLEELEGCYGKLPDNSIEIKQISKNISADLSFDGRAVIYPENVSSNAQTIYSILSSLVIIN